MFYLNIYNIDNFNISFSTSDKIIIKIEFKTAELAKMKYDELVSKIQSIQINFYNTVIKTNELIKN